jgi:hypothetical protein
MSIQLIIHQMQSGRMRTATPISSVQPGQHYSLFSQYRASNVFERFNEFTQTRSRGVFPLVPKLELGNKK